jgi:hypothetical protein
MIRQKSCLEEEFVFSRNERVSADTLADVGRVVPIEEGVDCAPVRARGA